MNSILPYVLERPVALYAALPMLAIATWISYTLLRRERLPNVEFLRIARKPGKAGGSDDVEAFMKDSLGAIMKGYTEYSKQGKHFLLRTPTQVYLMASSTMLEEIRKAPESQLSQPAAANIIFQIKHTLHPDILNDYYHFDVVRKSLTHNLPRIIGDLADETRFAFGVELGKCENWRQANVFQTATQIVTRISNRMMVGLALCRNDEFLHYSSTYTKATFDAAAMLRNVPAPLKSLVMYFNTSHKSQQQVARRLMLPIIKERIGIASTEGASPNSKGKPNDALQWLLDITPPEKMDPELILQRMIHINVTAIHAPAVTLTECVFDLCRHPEIHYELREEISEVLGNTAFENAWTKPNVDRLVKLDSFIRESARLTPMSAVKMERLAIKDFKFSDGTFVPKGTSIGVISHGRHMDEDLLPNAGTFDAFRYAKARAEPGKENQFTFGQSSQDNLLFGMGRHACPGRHFASVLIKLVLTHILVHYDIKFVDGVSPPNGKWTQKFRNPDFGYSIDWKHREAADAFGNAFPLV